MDALVLHGAETDLKSDDELVTTLSRTLGEHVESQELAAEWADAAREWMLRQSKYKRMVSSRSNRVNVPRTQRLQLIAEVNSYLERDLKLREKDDNRFLTVDRRGRFRIVVVD